ncbi:FBX41 protein, partial [Regulus satrapa]|nr:FBX41 protein [Regulus satrapa]
ICDAAVFPLAADGALLTPAARRDYFESTSFQGKDQRFSCDLVPAEELEPAPSASPSPRYVHEIEIPLSEIFTRGKAVAPAPAPPAAMDAAYEEGLARLKIRAFEKLEVDKRLEKLTEEVEQKIASQVGRLQVELDRKSSELEKAKQESLRLSREKQELEDRASELSRQVDVSVEMLASLKQDLVQKEQELTRKQQDLKSPPEPPLPSLSRGSSLAWALPGIQGQPQLLWAPRARACPLLPVRVCQLCLRVSVCLSVCPRPRGALRSAGQGSVYLVHTWLLLEPVRERGCGGHLCLAPLGVRARVPTCSPAFGERRGQPGPVSPGSPAREVLQIDQFLKETAAREANAKVRLQHFIEELLDRADRAEKQLQIISSSCGTTPNGSLGRCGTPAGRAMARAAPLRAQARPRHPSLEVISPEILKMRAALFCIFTYLDTRTLLRAAEVCKDWKFVARPPAGVGGVGRAGVSPSVTAAPVPQFLAMLSQWCTQMHSLTLQNLKPRQRGKKESKEDYMRSTRGCLEAGLESLLKATGGNLLILRISHCPNVLTDRSLWLASCYCRALQAVTYRSSTDPVGHEVIWALGAGCRDIISLQVAPLHPWRRPAGVSVGKPTQPGLRVLPAPPCAAPRVLTGHGALSAARNCMRLQVLELDHVAEINQEVAAEVCREGLKGLEMLVLTSTPVTPKALLHFNSVCRNLKSIVVQVGIVDYFKEPHSPEARKMFEEMVNKLQALRKRPGFSKILHIKVEGGC